MRVIVNTNLGYPKLNEIPSTSNNDNDDSQSDDYYSVQGSECSSHSLREVRPRLYWTQEKRDIIHQIFQDEMNNPSLLITRRKIKKVIKRLKEEKGFRTEARIRTFVHRLRNEFQQNKDSGDESLRAWYWTEERRQIIKSMLSDEINDRSVPVTKSKIKQALVRLNESTVLKNELRVRNFIYRLRAKAKQTRVKSEESASGSQSEEKFKRVVVDAEVYEHYLTCPLVKKESPAMNV